MDKEYYCTACGEIFSRSIEFETLFGMVSYCQKTGKDAKCLPMVEEIQWDQH